MGAGYVIGTRRDRSTASETAAASVPTSETPRSGRAASETPRSASRPSDVSDLQDAFTRLQHSVGALDGGTPGGATATKGFQQTGLGLTITFIPPEQAVAF